MKDEFEQEKEDLKDEFEEEELQFEEEGESVNTRGRKSLKRSF